tara:strand:+ start:928 stop:1176 length:249 start_codon:yes stop_codon:yes gene_type:complete
MKEKQATLKWLGLMSVKQSIPLNVKKLTLMALGIRNLRELLAKQSRKGEEKLLSEGTGVKAKNVDTPEQFRIIRPLHFRRIF